MPAPTRPILRYHGGKWRIAPWVISHLPPHRRYVEAFGGAGSVLLRKPRAEGEVYNDLDGEVVNVFRVLRDPVQAERLTSLLRLTPFAREELSRAFSDAPSDDPVERARRTIIKSHLGMGTDAITRASRPGVSSRGRRAQARYCPWPAPAGFRASDGDGVYAPSWAQFPDLIAAFTARLAGVVIEHRDALEVIQIHDTPETLHYCDPPYVLSTRADDRPDYRHELTDADHRALAEVLHQVQGMVVISGYPSDLYADLYGGWWCVRRLTYDARKNQKTEMLWMNPAAMARMQQSDLFEGALDVAAM